MKKILVIEDEQFLSEMYQMKLEREGFEVVLADNGKKGFKLSKKEKPDLILLDLVMPIMDGFETLTEIRKNKSTKNLKVCILSNLGQNSEIERSLEIGIDGYLIKANLTPSQLVENVLKLLAGEKLLKDYRKTTTNKKSVLLIEDEDDIIEMYNMHLVKDGYEVGMAKNGAWGLKLSEEKKFDIIVMDMTMPAMSGYEMLKRLRKKSKNIETPILVLSNSAQDNDIEKALEYGATSYLLKSNITPSKLSKEIKKII